MIDLNPTIKIIPSSVNGPKENRIICSVSLFGELSITSTVYPT
jgi:hypothetical protein